MPVTRRAAAAAQSQVDEPADTTNDAGQTDTPHMENNEESNESPDDSNEVTPAQGHEAADAEGSASKNGISHNKKGKRAKAAETAPEILEDEAELNTDAGSPSDGSIGQKTDGKRLIDEPLQSR